MWDQLRNAPHMWFEDCVNVLVDITGAAQMTKEYDMSDLQKPGQKPGRPGEYVERGPRGGSLPNPRRVTIEPGDAPLA